MATTRPARTRSQRNHGPMLHAVDVGRARPGAGAVPKFGVGPKRQELMFAQSVLLADIGVLVASFFVAYLIRTQLWYGGMLPLREFVWVLGLIIVLWPTLARSVGLTDSRPTVPRRMFLLPPDAPHRCLRCSHVYMRRREVSRCSADVSVSAASASSPTRVIPASSPERFTRARRPVPVIEPASPLISAAAFILPTGAARSPLLALDATEHTFCYKPVLWRMRTSSRGWTR